MPRAGPFSRLIEHFHTHPQGRLHEFAFWFGLAAAFGLFAWFGWRAGWLNDAIALVLGVIAIALALWSLLPQHRTRAAPPPPAKSKRKPR